MDVFWGSGCWLFSFIGPMKYNISNQFYVYKLVFITHHHIRLHAQEYERILYETATQRRRKRILAVYFVRFIGRRKRGNKIRFPPSPKNGATRTRFVFNEIYMFVYSIALQTVNQAMPMGYAREWPAREEHKRRNPPASLNFVLCHPRVSYSMRLFD